MLIWITLNLTCWDSQKGCQCTDLCSISKMVQGNPLRCLIAQQLNRSFQPLLFAHPSASDHASAAKIKCFSAALATCSCLSSVVGWLCPVWKMWKYVENNIQHQCQKISGWSRNWDRSCTNDWLGANSELDTKNLRNLQTAKENSRMSYTFAKFQRKSLTITLRIYYFTTKLFGGRGAPGFLLSCWKNLSFQRHVLHLRHLNHSMKKEASAFSCFFLKWKQGAKRKAVVLSSKFYSSFDMKDSDSSFCNLLHHKWVGSLTLASLESSKWCSPI